MTNYNTKMVDRSVGRTNIDTGFIYQFTLYSKHDDFFNFEKTFSDWCKDNLDDSEYYMESSSLSGRIIIYTHTYEASMAVRLTWEET